ncbi:MAG: symmetrical bis(5'-nucleosyl)-tetraphosphatase [Deltaproteobacteria bacterium]|nr:symmetrical bis(5'-nucleosyl)-tetraphosphatase [Deltaproteobacteria bacterium]
MATFAVGDVHGCYRTLRALLRRAGHAARRDRVWFVGDLVNGGAASLEVVRYVAELGERAVTVLGNHELHLLARAAGLARARRRDSLEALLSAPDAEALLEWTRTRPLLHRAEPFVLVHAGLLPAWSVAEAADLAVRASARLTVAEGATFAVESRRGQEVANPADERQVLLHATRAFTRLRCCTREGVLDDGFTGPPEEAPAGTYPWFQVPGRRSAEATVVCGHWAAAGLRRQPGLLALDSGCAWGRTLSAVRLEDGALFQEPLADRLVP